MIRGLTSAFIQCLFFISAHAQSEWQNLMNYPIQKEGRSDDIYFINDSTGWAVNGNSEIYKTNDYGKTWGLQFRGEGYFRSVEFINDTTGFVGSLRQAVYKTTDSGLTWNRIEHTFPQEVPGVCGITHYERNVLMVGIWSSPAYILRSHDGGDTWDYQDMSSYANALVDCWYKNADTVFVSGRGIDEKGIILRSVDGGNNWVIVTSSEVPDGIVWKLQFTDPAVGYASVYQGAGNETHILKTKDGGETYQLIKAVNKNIGLEGIGFINSLQGWIGGWSNGMYETTDGGVTWTYVSHGRNINRYFIIRENLVYAAGERMYVYKPRDPVVTDIEESPRNPSIHTLQAYPNPSGAKTKITIHIQRPTMAVMKLYDFYGKVVKQLIRKPLDAGVFFYELDPESLASGEYVVVLQTNEHSISKKIIIR
jgi:photosystem II stability/assembly factor-like uncharacterized protein